MTWVLSKYKTIATLPLSLYYFFFFCLCFQLKTYFSLTEKTDSSAGNIVSFMVINGNKSFDYPFDRLIYSQIGMVIQCQKQSVSTPIYIGVDTDCFRHCITIPILGTLIWVCPNSILNKIVTTSICNSSF